MMIQNKDPDIAIPAVLKGQPWSDILWKDVLQYARIINTHLNLPSSPTIIDVGGNIGAATILFHLEYRARVISIEAIAETCTILQKNCSSFPLITTVHRAIGESEDSISLYRYPLASGLGGLASSRWHIWSLLCTQAFKDISPSQIRDILLLPIRIIGLMLWMVFALFIVCTRTSQQVEQQTLSQIIEQHCPNSSIDLLKIDIEGHELHALRGIHDQHWPLIKAIIMEVHPQNKQEVLLVLHEHHFHICAQEQGVIQGEAVPEVIIAKYREEKDINIT
jgi:FkbM family methyltransferase